jgi:hypothetical protein
MTLPTKPDAVAHVSDARNPNTLSHLLRYDAATGKLYWRERGRAFFKSERAFKSWNTRYAGAEALTAKTGNGYKSGDVLNTRIHAHRAAFAIHHGKWPSMIDHINGDGFDNRISNLREVTKVENARNAKTYRHNKSGVMGVSFSNVVGKWEVRITVNRKNLFLGYFSEFDRAAAARRQAEHQYGFHPNHGRIMTIPEATQ